MKEIRLRFDFSFSRRFLRCAAVAVMVLAAAPELDSESVTLTTVYPAPSGIYTRLITTGNTVLSRDAIGKLSVGTAVAPAAGTKMAVIGNVGIGRTDAPSMLSVAGGIQIGDDGGACNGAKAGTQRFHLGILEICDGVPPWKPLGGGGGGGGGVTVYQCPYVWYTPGCNECTNSCVGQIQLGATCIQRGAGGVIVGGPQDCNLVGTIQGP